MNSKKVFTTIITALAFIACAGQKETINPVPFNKVTLTDGFWKDRMHTEIEVTVPFSVFQSEPAIERFRRTATWMAGEETELPEPHRFISSDLYKVMEGVAYSLMIEPNQELEKFMDDVIDYIGASQQPDGYLYISHICGNPIVKDMGPKPYTWVIHSHELYNVGHLYEAAVAYYQATGKEKLLDIAIKNAKHVNKVFFEGGDPNYNDGKPINQAPGHEEIELALCKLYRVTGDRLYLDMAKRFLDIRGVTYIPDGEGVMSATYAQQHAPVKDQTEAVGHAVRAAYLYTAMAQVDALTGRDDYGKALNAIWGNLVSTRMHITGGLGAVEGVEGFGEPYDLPNLTAYNETCAAVANVFFNHAMYLNTGDAKYLDVAELSLYNNALAGINIAGDRFFYVNPLETDGVRRFNHGHAGRAEWFGCACCPPNISRLILQVPGYMYAYGRDKIYLTIYGGSKTEIPLDDTAVSLEQQSAYPFDGRVRVKVDPVRKSRFSVYLRIPAWADSDQFVPGGLYPFKNGGKSDISLIVNGKPTNYKKEKGFAVIKRTWSPGDVIELSIDMPVRFVESDSRITVNNGATAVTRGPLVYCAEEPDNGGRVGRLFTGGIQNNAWTDNVKEGVLKGIPMVHFNGMELFNSQPRPAMISMIPYYAWDNRGDFTTMKVWLPDDVPSQSQTNPAAGSAGNIEKINVSSVLETTNVSKEALTDGLIAESSSDLASVPAWISLPGDVQQASIYFKQSQPVSSLSVYWLEDESRKVKLPVNWSVEYLQDGAWNKLDLYVTDSYQLGKDRFNVVHPSRKLTTSALRINIEPAKGYSAAISEIRME